MQREIHGGNVYGREVRLDFSVNINPLGMPQGVRQAITRHGTKRIRILNVRICAGR